MKSETELLGNGVTGSSAVLVIGVVDCLIKESIILNCLWNCDLANRSKSESNSENVFGRPICLHARNSAARINIEAVNLVNFGSVFSDSTLTRIRLATSAAG